MSSSSRYLASPYTPWSAGNAQSSYPSPSSTNTASSGARAHHHYPPLPPQNTETSTVTLNPALIYSSRSQLSFDMAAPPPYYNNELATSSPLPSIAIVCPQFPWPIVVFSSTPYGVTVGDVHSHLYNFMSSPSAGPNSPPRLYFLKGRRVFIGLTKSHIGSETWTMHCVA